MNGDILNLEKSYKDSKGNVLIFYNDGEDTVMNIDGGDCSEGVQEIIRDRRDITQVLIWYGYDELAQIFEDENN